jgi:protein TonB
LLVVGLSLSFPVAGYAEDAAQGTPEARTEARLVRARKPSYPEQAWTNGIEGQVILWLQISAEGDVLDVKVHRSSGHRVLDDHTKRFAWTLEFVPARRGATAIPTTVLLPVRYRLVD